MLDPVEFGNAMAVIVRDAMAPLLQRIDALEARQLLKGDPGDKGERGADAEPIEISAVAAEVLAGDEMRTLVDLHVAESVAKYFEANPVKHGKDGESVRGEKGEKGDSIKGEPGENGVGVAGAFIDRTGQLILTTTKGEAVPLGKVVGDDGKDGVDGGDMSEAAFDYDYEEGALVMTGKNGVELRRKLSIPMYKGYWREGMVCDQSGIVTHNGSAWIAIRKNLTKPCIENADDWQLFVRKGRDGADGTNGRNLGPQPPVKLNGNA